MRTPNSALPIAEMAIVIRSDGVLSVAPVRNPAE
jgi:hypothetical protein